VNGRVLVMCATRNRPQQFAAMVESVRKTSTKADLVAYVDQDQREMYETVEADMFFGERVGQCRSLNELARRMPGYSAYGSATDDCIYETPGWDSWVLKNANRLTAFAPFCEAYGRMDFPWISARWLEAAGYFCPLETRHFYWDVALQIAAEDVGLLSATKEQFHISHSNMEWFGEEMNDENGFKTGVGLSAYYIHRDAMVSMIWLAHERRAFVEKLRAKALVAA